MNRSFAKATIEINGGRRIPAVIACCSSCGHTHKISANNFSGSIPPEASANRFRHEGWFIGNKDGKDLCPECFKGKKRARAVKGPNVVELVTVKADPPREMSREDRRLIFAKIDEVYLDESKGYSSGWSDKKVASDLGVPAAWVKTIREENFGSEGSNEDLKALIAEANEMAKILHEGRNAIADLLDDMRKRAPIDKITEIQAKLSKIEKDMK